MMLGVDATAIGTVAAAVAAAISAVSARQTAKLVRLESERRADEVRDSKAARFTVAHARRYGGQPGAERSVYVVQNTGRAHAHDVTVRILDSDGTHLPGPLDGAPDRFPIRSFPAGHSVDLTDSSLADGDTAAEVEWSDELGEGHTMRMPI